MLALGLTLGVIRPSAAWAQLGSGPVGTTGHAGQLPNRPQKPPEPAPEAMPGSRAKEPAAPATRPAGDMQPTDALFDAINRGDIASARDALNRGADLNGVNVLGMTPMELSVDLGRNDISFLLLSMRGEDSSRGSRAVGLGAQPANLSDNTAKASPGKKVPVKLVQTGGIIPAKPVATPKLFANDGGTPVPSAGFLGFGSRSASN
ncbi:ankyrin repeat domain-containing protein [Rhodopila sp.]|uniref:ankyrin repeat domain-containing protein n=1 Tax=Rhodopila sp. TaxID=2480087 RepID=UPI003D10D365